MVKKRKRNTKSIRIDIRVLIALISVSALALIALVITLAKPNEKKSIEKLATKLAGTYRGDLTTAECPVGKICRDGYSPYDYIELREDRTCYTNIKTLSGSGPCTWGETEDPEIAKEYPYYLAFPSNPVNSFNYSISAPKNEVRFSIEGDRIVFFYAYLKKDSEHQFEK